MAEQLPVAHHVIVDELTYIIHMLTELRISLQNGEVEKAEGGDDVATERGTVEADVFLRRFHRHLELAGQKALTLANAIDPEIT